MAKKPLQGTIRDDRITSRELDEDIPLIVYTPPHYTPLQSYQVLICQDGNDYFQIGRIPRVVEELLDEGEISETIIVGIPYPSVDIRRERYFPKDIQNEAYIRFLANELLPYLDEHYPIEPLAHARTLAGDSLGGTVSLVAAVRYPSLFGKVMMHSPFVNEDVINEVTNCKHSEDLSVYHVIGLQETAVNTTDGNIVNFLPPNRELREVMEQMSFTYEYYEFDGDHKWVHWQKDLPRGVKHLLS
ncbi:esterase family protein [Halalkalibacter sp. APA_J-10(15)]|uniref:alpha/beta hydrolase n=1 Tax=unclassified Halalkalibacter TaxID=2893063 RepID=UPI001FF6866D|nr:alpha/beta hydrolase-fold protein [Halalkalibacter sp. APA_J-10(15)]MCK0471496.1 alpha/beta hydrolase-fold protein [Halalkalibacter sp. APA_J-10(15)]